MHKLILAYATYFSRHGPRPKASIDAGAAPLPPPPFAVLHILQCCNIHYLACPYVRVFRPNSPIPHARIPILR